MMRNQNQLESSRKSKSVRFLNFVSGIKPKEQFTIASKKLTDEQYRIINPTHDKFYHETENGFRKKMLSQRNLRIMKYSPDYRKVQEYLIERTRFHNERPNIQAISQQLNYRKKHQEQFRRPDNQKPERQTHQQLNNDYYRTFKSDNINVNKHRQKKQETKGHSKTTYQKAQPHSQRGQIQHRSTIHNNTNQAYYNGHRERRLSSIQRNQVKNQQSHEGSYREQSEGLRNFEGSFNSNFRQGNTSGHRTEQQQSGQQFGNNGLYKQQNVHNHHQQDQKLEHQRKLQRDKERQIHRRQIEQFKERQIKIKHSKQKQVQQRQKMMRQHEIRELSLKQDHSKEVTLFQQKQRQLHDKQIKLLEQQQKQRKVELQLEIDRQQAQQYIIQNKEQILRQKWAEIKTRQENYKKQLHSQLQQQQEQLRIVSQQQRNKNEQLLDKRQQPRNQNKQRQVKSRHTQQIRSETIIQQTTVLQDYNSKEFKRVINSLYCCLPDLEELNIDLQLYQDPQYQRYLLKELQEIKEKNQNVNEEYVQSLDNLLWKYNGQEHKTTQNYSPTINSFLDKSIRHDKSAIYGLASPYQFASSPSENRSLSAKMVQSYPIYNNSITHGRRDPYKNLNSNIRFNYKPAQRVISHPSLQAKGRRQIKDFEKVVRFTTTGDTKIVVNPPERERLLENPLMRSTSGKKLRMTVAEKSPPKLEPYSYLAGTQY